MLIEIKLPQLADGMTTAAITAWLKDVGDSVTKGEPIVEVDIDKTTIELEAPASGVLQGIRVPSGAEDVPVGTVLAVIAPAAIAPAGIDTAVGDTASGHTAVGTAGAIPQAEAADSARRPTLKPPPSAGAMGSSHQSAGAPAPRQLTPATAAAAATTSVAPVSDAVTPVQSPSVVTTKVDASPLARRMAELLGLDLATVHGTGPGGRIRKVDVDRRGSSTP
jgi:pyruvate dehydrogenase E2 component (dihydrolipoamide acetyltransferase)